MSNFGSFSYFQTSISLRVGQVFQNLPTFDINDLKLLFHCYILISRKCPRKTPFKTQWGGGISLTPLHPSSPTALVHCLVLESKKSLLRRREYRVSHYIFDYFLEAWKKLDTRSLGFATGYGRKMARSQLLYSPNPLPNTK